VVGRGDSQVGFTAQFALIVDERYVLFGEQQFPYSALKRHCPVIRLLGVPSPCIGMQIVHDITAPDQEDTLISQNRKSLAQIKVKRGWLRFIDAELDHRNLRERIGMAKD